MNNVIFFDGFCGLCDAVVSRLLPYAGRGRFQVSSLQGDHFRLVLGRHPGLARVDSVVYVENFGRPSESVRVKSDAVIAILGSIGGLYRVPLFFFRLLPGGARDAVYDWVARNRTRIFPVRDTCRLPTAEERALFLP